MKKFFLPALAFSGLFLQSCSEDFTVSAPYKQYTVLNGLLNPLDTAHYIRVQKAYLSETQSAVDLAQVADSNYFTNITVLLQQLNTNGQATTVDTFRRVDLMQEGITKNDGTFFTSPSFAYKSKYALTPGTSYTVRVLNPLTTDTIYGTTKIVGTQFVAPAIDQANYQIRISGVGTQTPFFSLRVITRPDESVVVEGVFRIRYADSNTTTNVVRRDSFDFTFAQSSEITPDLRTSISGFLNSFAGKLSAPPQNTVRLIAPSRILLFAANQDYQNYVIYSKDQGGVTADQLQPVYTNIQAKMLSVFWLPARIASVLQFLSKIICWIAFASVL